MVDGVEYSKRDADEKKKERCEKVASGRSRKSKLGEKFLCQKYVFGSCSSKPNFCCQAFR